MKLSRKTVIGLVAVAAVGYYIYDRQRKGKSLNPFKSFTAEEDAFLNSWLNVGGEEGASVKGGKLVRYQGTGIFSTSGCKTYRGNANSPVGTILDDGSIITATGAGFTTVCKRSR